uniref:Diguanylate cyclase/phosphodiesterase n=1 Tax=Rhodopseudomonas palustris (strain BisA53) TaxID=316055 RepID=Q07T95_RHOP5
MPNQLKFWRHLTNHWPLVMAVVFMMMTLVVVGELYLSQKQLHRATENYLVADSVRRSEEIDDFLRERRMAATRLASSHTIEAFLANRALGMSLQYGLNANLDFIEADFSKEVEQSKFRGRPIYQGITFFGETGAAIAWTGRQEAWMADSVSAEQAAIVIDSERNVIVATAPVLRNGTRQGTILAIIDLDVLSALLIANTAEQEASEYQEFLLIEAGNRVLVPENASALSPADALLLAKLPERKPTVTRDIAGLNLGAEFVALRTPVRLHPISILTLTSEKTAFREIGSPLRAIYIGALYLALFAAALGFERMRHRALRLQSDIAESNRHRDELEAKNSELFAEIARRVNAEGELASKQERIRELAFFDQLTGLPNRTCFIEQAQQVLDDAAAVRKRSALLFIDLDNFKTLNDTLGHNMGDMLLQQAAKRLLDCIDHTGSVARFGGDEFVVLLPALAATTEAEAELAAGAVAEAILQSLSRPYDLAGIVHSCPPSVGIALVGLAPTTFDELLQQADLAMYEAKAAGRNTLRFFAPSMQATISQRRALEADLRDDLRVRNFELHFQAQIDVAGRLVGAEALIRWPHKRRGYVPPDQFIGIAETTGLILPIGNWVIEEACNRLKQWSARPGLANLSLAINVSAVQLHDEQFVDHLVATLERTGADPNLLKLELTESVLIDCNDDVIERMNRLREKGVRFSLDDFGTGYSSLLYLRKLPIEQLKIDRSFVRDILVDANDAAIAKMIIALGKTLGLDVLAEGVETEGQLRELIEMGCDAYQGYLISRPVPVSEFERQAMGAAAQVSMAGKALSRLAG